MLVSLERARQAQREIRLRPARMFVCTADDPHHWVEIWAVGYVEAWCRHGRLRERP